MLVVHMHDIVSRQPTHTVLCAIVHTPLRRKARQVWYVDPQGASHTSPMSSCSHGSMLSIDRVCGPPRVSSAVTLVGPVSTHSEIRSAPMKFCDFGGCRFTGLSTLSALSDIDSVDSDGSCHMETLALTTVVLT